jgi:ribosomal protein S18 acetylase RimI-like enzyme
VKIQFIRIIKPTDLESIRKLYQDSFPPEERREFFQLQQLVSDHNLFVNQIIADANTVAGFCIFWTFDEFAFIEHLAVNPELRGVGIGEETLSILREKFKVLVLETELPADEISKRRIKFYERNGFCLLERQYFQPSYGNGKPEVELKIMCTKADISHEKLDEYILQIRKKVYRSIS